MKESEKSFFYRHCICIPPEWKNISDYLIKILKENLFEVYSFTDTHDKTCILVSQQNEEKMLRQAQYLRIKKVYALYEEPKDILLPKQVIKFEKEKAYDYTQRQHFLPNDTYNLLHDQTDTKKTDERWGLGLFSETEMLSIEKALLDDITIPDKKTLIGLLKDNKIDVFASHSQFIENEKKLLALLIELNIVSGCIPLHISNFAEKIIKKTIFSIESPFRYIRSYFNDRIAMYFAWTYYYTRSLLLPAIVSIIIGLLMRIYPEQRKSFLVFFSIFIPFWAQFFIVTWNRKTSELSIEWDNYDEVYDKENQRKEFKGVWQRSPITNEFILVYPTSERLIQFSISFIKSLSILLLALLVNIIFLNLMGFIRPNYKSVFLLLCFSQYSDEGRLFAVGSTPNMFLGYLQLIVIMILNKYYRTIAEETTKAENHQNRSNHENTLIIKRFLFEFFDSFFSLFYIAFIVKDIDGLRSMLITIFFGNQIRRVATETILPNLSSMLIGFDVYKKFVKGGNPNKFLAVKGNEINHNDVLLQIGLEEYDTFDDYLEPVLEFAYLTLFAECFPYASLFIILFNFIERRSDIFKLGSVFRRPDHVRRRNIGSWHMIIQIIAILSVFTNLLFVFMYTANKIEMNYDNLLSFSIAEHFTLALIIAIRVIIPVQKAWVKLFFARREFKLKENKWKIVLKRFCGEHKE